MHVPNIVVDGSPNASTVLTLTHWPGIAQPPGLAADLSAEMAFNYLDAPCGHAPADLVTNNHFDQDGLVGVHAFIEPELSLRHRDRLIDVAASGDFATYRFRESARASMAIWAYAQPDRSPLGSQLDGPYEQASALLYETVLPLLVPMIEDSDRFRDLWGAEDAALTMSEQAISDGTVTIEELNELDLAIVTVPSGAPLVAGGTTDTEGSEDAVELAGGHRFASDMVDLIHPIAINNATQCCRLLIIRGRQYLFIDRYETWVQYRRRVLPPRVDMNPLRDQLEAMETGPATWTAGRAASLSPSLRSSPESSLSLAAVRSTLVDHLRTAPAAWDPFHIGS